MKHKSFLFAVFFIQALCVIAQTGINNENPEATLDVDGDVLVRGKLYLEDPGWYTGLDDVNLLVINNTNEIRKYDVEISDYGPINYVQFIFENLASAGLDTFNTRIDADKYTLAVHGFSFTDTGGGTSVTNRKTSGSPTSNRTRYMEGPQFYAYVQSGTWRLRGRVNNSPFYNGNTATQVDLKMDVIIYRNDFITKIWPTVQTVDMDNEPDGTAALPSGF